MQIKLQLEELEERTTPSVVAVDDSTFATYGSQSVTSNVLMNDAGYPLTASVVTAPSHGTLSLNSDGSYTYTHTDLSFSGYDVAIYRASDGSSYDDGALTIQVMDAMSSTSIVPSSYSVLEGESITFTATVSDMMSLSGSPTPSGSVVFKEGSTTLATVSLNSSGVATFSISSLSVDMHTITAEYVGSMPYSSSSNSTIVTVSKATTMTSLSASPSSIHQGESVTLTATVTSDGAGTPTGTVVFKEGSTTLGSSTVDGSGIATFSTSDWPTTGLLSITAEFTGTGWFDNSSGDTILMVSANSAPTLDTISNQSHAEGATGTFPIASATDPESQTITYSANNLPTGLSINASTGVISGTIGYSAYYNAPSHDGVYMSSVTATDIYGRSDTKNFTWTVANTARALHWLYTGSGTGDGTDGANWTDNTVPESGDILIFGEGTGDCDLTGFGSGFVVDGVTTEEGYEGTVFLPSAFNIGVSGLQMNAGALEIDASLNLLGESIWSGGDLNSKAATAADLNLFANFLVPSPSGGITAVALKHQTNFNVMPNVVALINVAVDKEVEIEFLKGAGVVVQSGGEFKFTGSGFAELLVMGANVGTFEVKGGGTCTVDKKDGQARVNLYFRQTGVEAETAIKSGEFLLRGKDAQGYMAVISAGRVVIYGDATLDVTAASGGQSNGILFQSGSVLMTEQSDAADIANVVGNVKVDGGSITIDGAGVGELKITGNLDLNGTLTVTIDFTNANEDLIKCTGTAKLRGTLIIERQGAHVPNWPIVFVDAGTIDSGFDPNLIQKPQGETYDVDYNATKALIST